MGASCCGTKNVKYEHEGKVHTIGKKQAGTLERFSAGASARIQVNKLKMQMAKDITGEYSCQF
jgi:hypothetical protein